jgi:hypothetical protein
VELGPLQPHPFQSDLQFSLKAGYLVAAKSLLKIIVDLLDETLVSFDFEESST